MAAQWKFGPDHAQMGWWGCVMVEFGNATPGSDAKFTHMIIALAWRS